MESDPLIVTLEFDAASFQRLQTMRVRHFPAHRNHIPAHLTLFHKLPGEDAAEIAETLRNETRDHPPVRLEATGLRFLGYGCAYEIASPALVALRQGLAARWRDRLSPQDAQGFRPHVTIQNKAPSGEAKALHAELSAAFAPFEATGTAVLLWHYRGGPWAPAGRFPFAANRAGFGDDR